MSSRSVSHDGCIDRSVEPYIGVPFGADPAVTGAVEGRVEADVKSGDRSREGEEENDGLHGD